MAKSNRPKKKKQCHRKKTRHEAKLGAAGKRETEWGCGNVEEETGKEIEKTGRIAMT